MLLHFIGNTTPTNSVEAGVVLVLGYGLLGVDLFFVLSGFLITGILFDARFRPNYFRNFYVRRSLRIFPLYYGTLVVLLVVLPRIPGMESDDLAALVDNQAWLWLYGANVFHALEGEWALSYANHFWSLAIEEHFYFAWPLLVWVLRNRPRALLWASVGIAIGSRAAGVAAGILSSSATIALATPFQLQGIALGSVIAIYARQPGGGAAIVRWLPRVALGAGGALLASFFWHWYTEFGQSVLGPLRPSMFVALLACLVVWSLVAPRGSWTHRLFTSRSMTFLGTYSYGLYVFHHFISYYFTKHRTEFVIAEWIGSHTAAVLIQASIGFAASIAVAYASFHLVEKHFVALKGRFGA